MMSEGPSVLVVDSDDAWRSDLVQALEAEGVHARCTDNGDKIEPALLGEDGKLSAIVLGRAPHGIGPIEALYRAGTTRSPDKWDVTGVFLVTDVRSDLELLELLRRRGVKHFLYGTDPLE